MPIRETFWNIPQWAEIAQYVLGFVTILVFAYGVWRRVRRWRSGKPEQRSDHLGSRLLSALAQSAGQLRIAEDVYAGIMHLAIFWGMVMLFIGTILATADWDVTRLFMGFQFLKDGVYVVYELVLDIFGILLLAGLGMAAYRRYVLKPERLKNVPQSQISRDDAYALVMLGLIALSGYLVEGLRIAVIKPAWANWSPVGKLMADLLVALGDPTNRSLHLVIWTFHMLAAFTFIASIPYTKLFHIVATPVNIFYRSMKPAGALPPAREGSLGVNSIQDFTWKQILDFEACTRCGRCQDQCPAYASGLSLSPRDLMIRLDLALWQRNNGHALLGETIRADEVWACTTCRACDQICPAFTDHVSAIVDLRRSLVEAGQMDKLLQDALGSLARYGNSFGQSERVRAKWAQAVDPKIKDARKGPVDYLWFVGDYASYHTNVVGITAKTAAILQRAGLDFGILYEAERNAGNDVRRVGEEGLFEVLVEKNAMTLGKCNYNTLVTTDPHTYNTLKNEYSAESLVAHPVLHISELLDKLITSGKLQLSKKLGYRVTYQDPCYLARYNGITEEPRRVIRAVGCELVEMPGNRQSAFCCGAGGGRIWMEEKGVKERPSEIRMRQAAQLEGVEALIVACPKDAAMFKDALKTCGYENRLVIKDLAELVYEAL
jgi:Fe-S oxidoreductase/nitrate reductase gamma subunit